VRLREGGGTKRDHFEKKIFESSTLRTIMDEKKFCGPKSLLSRFAYSKSALEKTTRGEESYELLSRRFKGRKGREAERGRPRRDIGGDLRTMTSSQDRARAVRKD